MRRRDEDSEMDKLHLAARTLASQQYSNNKALFVALLGEHQGKLALRLYASELRRIFHLELKHDL